MAGVPGKHVIGLRREKPMRRQGWHRLDGVPWLRVMLAPDVQDGGSTRISPQPDDGDGVEDQDSEPTLNAPPEGRPTGAGHLGTGVGGPGGGGQADSPDITDTDMAHDQSR